MTVAHSSCVIGKIILHTKQYTKFGLWYTVVDGIKADELQVLIIDLIEHIVRESCSEVFMALSDIGEWYQLYLTVFQYIYIL